MTRTRALVVVAAMALLATTACDPKSSSAESSQKVAAKPATAPDDGADTPEADDASPDPEGPDPVAAKDEGPRELTVKLDGSKIGFYVSKATLGHEAEFERYTAKLGMEGLEPKKLSIELDMNSLKTDQSALTRHLQSKDFFHAEKFPKATFEAKEIVKLGERNEDATHTVTGDLTIKDVTKELVFPALVKVSEGEVTGEATMTVLAKDFGIDYPGMAEELVDDKVELEVKLVFPESK